MTTQYDNIFLASTPREGRLRLAEASGLGWKSYDKDEPEANVVMLPKDEIKWALWTRVARNFQVCIGQKKSEERLVFENFHRDDFDPLNKIFKVWGHELEAKETSLRGWNWGQVDVQGPNLAFLVNQKQSFLLPLASIANSNIASKTEVSLEIAPPAKGEGSKAAAGSKARPFDELVEMRFHVPGMTGTGSDDDESDDERAEGEERVSKAQAFHEMIKERADIGDVGTPGVVVFNEVLVLTPRGRYDVDMFLTHFRLRGKTYDYKILHTSVTRLFLLPKADEIHVQLVVGLDPPIRQGQTRYPYLVMQFTKDEEMDAELNLSEEELDKHALKRTYEAPAYQVVSQVFKALTGRKITPPSSFISTLGQNVVKCNLKANQGELYLLEKAMIFIARQPLLVDFANIQTVSFSRVGGNMASSKTFDLSISLKARTDGGSDYSFTSLPKDDAGPIKAFLEARKVRVKDKTEEDLAAVLSDADDDMSEEEEEDSDASADAGGKKKKASKGKERESKAVAVTGADLDDDDDESDDEDFQASSSDGGSASSSSDEGGSDADGDVQMKSADKPKKKKKSAEDGPAKKKAKVADDA